MQLNYMGLFNYRKSAQINFSANDKRHNPREKWNYGPILGPGNLKERTYVVQIIDIGIYIEYMYICIISS